MGDLFPTCQEAGISWDEGTCFFWEVNMYMSMSVPVGAHRIERTQPHSFGSGPCSTDLRVILARVYLHGILVVIIPLLSLVKLPLDLWQILSSFWL